MPRWRLACDTCSAGGWIGPADDAGSARRTSEPADAWCEGCQSGHRIGAGAAGPMPCPRCGVALTVGEPRFEELLGEGQNLASILSAWCGDSEPLAALLPDRPRFLTDLDPPAPHPDDPPAARTGLEALTHGQFARARDLLARALVRPDAPGHLWRALGAAAQRSGDLALAETAFTRAIEAEPHDTSARLNRGALRVRHGDFARAREDFALAGDRREARWNRAALLVVEGLSAPPGLPARETLQRARDQAGEASAYWSDHTVGRLLWTLLVERELARSDGETPAADARALRAAEKELEFDTFWDRALVVHGYARLGLRREAAGSAEALAMDLVGRLAAEPFARGPAGAWLAARLESIGEAVRTRRPGDALATLQGVLRRPEVKAYRVPCVACGMGALGVASYEDVGAEP